MIVVVDYGMGNLRSVQKGFEKVGQQAVISRDPAANHCRQPPGTAWGRGFSRMYGQPGAV